MMRMGTEFQILYGTSRAKQKHDLSCDTLPVDSFTYGICSLLPQNRNVLENAGPSNPSAPKTSQKPLSVKPVYGPKTNGMP